MVRPNLVLGALRYCVSCVLRRRAKRPLQHDHASEEAKTSTKKGAPESLTTVSVTAAEFSQKGAAIGPSPNNPLTCPTATLATCSPVLQHNDPDLSMRAHRAHITPPPTVKAAPNRRQHGRGPPGGLSIAAGSSPAADRSRPAAAAAAAGRRPHSGT